MGVNKPFPDIAIKILPFLIGAVVFGCISLFLGQDASWDLKNYHFYNPYEFLNNLHKFHILAAQTANFYNPLLDIPFYLIVQTLKPMHAGFVMGAIHGLNLGVLFLLCHECLAGLETAKRLSLSFLLAIAGMLGAISISEVGTFFHDNVVSLFVLSALYLLIKNMDFISTKRNFKVFAFIFAVGVLAGIGPGLKQTTAIFAVGLCSAIFFLKIDLKQRFLLAFAFGCGVIAGFLAFSGHWMYKLWTEYQNPLFPYYNHLLKAPMATIGDYKDGRFLPQNWAETLLFPFIFTKNPNRVSESIFFDLRWTLCYSLSFTCLLWVLAKKILKLIRKTPANVIEFPQIHRNLSDPARRRFVFWFIAVAYLAWLKMFSIMRYLAGLEMLMPLAILLVLDGCLEKKSLKIWVSVGLIAVCMVTVKPADWERVSWADSFFGIDAPKLERPDKSIVLLTGHAPISYTIPFFPEKTRFIRIQSWFTSPSDNPNGYDKLMEDILKKHDGDLYLLYQSHPAEKEMTLSAFKGYQLGLMEESCVTVKSHLEKREPLLFCKVKKIHPKTGE